MASLEIKKRLLPIITLSYWDSVEACCSLSRPHSFHHHKRTSTASLRGNVQLGIICILKIATQWLHVDIRSGESTEACCTPQRKAHWVWLLAPYQCALEEEGEPTQNMPPNPSSQSQPKRIPALMVSLRGQVEPGWMCTLSCSCQRSSKSVTNAISVPYSTET